MEISLIHNYKVRGHIKRDNLSWYLSCQIGVFDGVYWLYLRKHLFNREQFLYLNSVKEDVEEIVEIGFKTSIKNAAKNGVIITSNEGFRIDYVSPYQGKKIWKTLDKS